jgi:hypothetical protein
LLKQPLDHAAKELEHESDCFGKGSADRGSRESRFDRLGKMLAEEDSSLLLLLSFGRGRLLGLVQELRPFFVGREFLVGR